MRYQITDSDRVYRLRRDHQIAAAEGHSRGIRKRALRLIKGEPTPAQKLALARIETLAFANQMQRLAFEERKRPDGATARLIYVDPERQKTWKSEYKELSAFAKSLNAPVAE